MKKDTISVHGGVDYSQHNNSISPPIYPSTAFSFDSMEHAINLFDLKEAGDIYTRISNPTTDILEKRVAALEGGVGALALSSGQSASMIAVLNIANSGDEIVAGSTLYGGTLNLLAVSLKKLGVITKFIDPNDINAINDAITDKTKCVFVESLGNPKLNVVDIEKIADVAHQNDIPLIVDNTVATPILCNPFEFGADIIVHSATKYLGGHGNAMGGIIVDSGSFDWAKSGKFPEFTSPDDSYHGTIYTETFGNLAFIIKARVQLLRDYGCCISPFNSYLLLQGIDTLSLRMQRVSQSALKVTQYLENHSLIERVIYPGLSSHPDYTLSEKYLPKGQSSLFSFEIKGDGAKFIESLKLLIHATNLGDSRTIITYPAGTTHRQLSDEALEQAGITKGLFRVSIGLEDVDDIIEDIDNALKLAQ